MKVREIEKDVYNMVQKKEIVTHEDLKEKFGTGDFGMTNQFIPSAVVCVGLSEELAGALEKLKSECKIFEIACGMKFFELCFSNGHIYNDLPIMKFEARKIKYPYKNYGYRGPFFLPVVLCSDSGIKKLNQVFFRALKQDHTKLYSSIFSNLDDIVKSNNETRLVYSVELSELLSSKSAFYWDNIALNLQRKTKLYKSLQKMFI